MFAPDTIVKSSLVKSAPVVSTVVAIPVCNEELHIEPCLRALDSQRGLAVGSLGVLLLLNNCTDGTAARIAALAPDLTCALKVVVRDDPAASAGWARRRAMDAAAMWIEEGSGDGVLLTTDADSRAPSDWVARNVRGIAAGADAVAGRLALDPVDAALLPAALHERGALEAEYEALLAEITARLDPTPGNPWPHHWCRSGASLATSLGAYRAIGGIPDIPCGEDRAFVDRLLASDLVVRHDPDLVVVTSGRLLGRAKGGVADTIRLRCDHPESLCDDRLEPVGSVVSRALLRRRLRRLHRDGQRAALRRRARALGIDGVNATRIAGLSTFGAMHAALESASSRLGYRPLRPADLPRQIRRARMFVALLRVATSRHQAMSGTQTKPAAVTPGTIVVAAYD